MEYTQWALAGVMGSVVTLICLNPCCNGIYSMSNGTIYNYKELAVLILVVMEYTQWAG